MPGGWNKGLTLLDWDKKVKDKFGDSFVLVSVGETKADGVRSLRVRCLTCGTEKDVSSISFRGKHGNHGHCENCLIKTNKINRQITSLNKKLKEEKIQTKNRLTNKQVSLRFCKCGNILGPRKLLCSTCAEKNKKEYQKEQWRQKDIKRRARLQKVKHDSDLSLLRLYERDKGICHLCGKQCDYSDGEWKDGTFIAGNNYPSVDHLITIASGGSDTWDNVKLAHRLCNSKRGVKDLVS